MDGFGGSDLCMSKQYMSWIENIYRVVAILPPVASLDGWIFSHCLYIYDFSGSIWMLDGRAAAAGRRLFHFDLD